MNLLTAEGISKVYTERVVLDNVDFSINEGDKIGIIGINGTGKSTLLKIIAGVEEADSGEIKKGRNVLIRYLSQNPEFDEDDTVINYVVKNNISEENKWSIESEAKTILNKLGITDFEADVKYLSGGQKKKVALASVLVAKAEILILDEPTNHLDQEMIVWLQNYLIAYRGAIVMITHDRYFLDEITNRIVETDNGHLYNYDAGYSGYLSLKIERENMEQATYRKNMSVLRTELAWIRRGARARSTKQKARIERYEILKEVKPPKKDGKVVLSSISSRMGKKTIEANNICKSFDNRCLIDDFTYIFLKNDRIGIVGENGCGKSTLIKIVTGVLEPDSGTVETGETIRAGYFAQENEYMDPSERVIDYIKSVGDYINTTDGVITASQMLERFLFDSSMHYTTIEKLSGGEKRRLYLAKILMSSPNVLVLDEPTNDLDITTLAVLEDYLDEFDGIVITVSHDRYFLDRVVDRIFAFEGNGVITQYEGGYSDYVSKRSDTQENEKREVKEEREKVVKVREKRLKFTYKEEKEYETIDDDIAALEDKISELEGEIEKAATSYGKLKELMEEKEKVESELEEKMDRWMYLSELASKIEAQKKGND